MCNNYFEIVQDLRKKPIFLAVYLSDLKKKSGWLLLLNWYTQYPYETKPNAILKKSGQCTCFQVKGH